MLNSDVRSFKVCGNLVKRHNMVSKHIVIDRQKNNIVKD